MPLPEARAAVRSHFERNAAIKDDRVLEMLVERGYMELEGKRESWFLYYYLCDGLNESQLLVPRHLAFFLTTCDSFGIVM
jgi:hypothetical protein